MVSRSIAVALMAALMGASLAWAGQVDVELLAKWSSTPLSQESVEFLSEVAPDRLWDFVEAVAGGEPLPTHEGDAHSRITERMTILFILFYFFFFLFLRRISCDM